MLPPVRRKSHPPLWHQFRVLTARYVELLFRDRGNLRLLSLQAPVVAFFILLGFLNKPYDEKMLAPRTMQPDEKKLMETFGRLARKAFDQLDPKGLAEVDPEGKTKDMVEVLEELPSVKGPAVPHKLIVNPRFTYILIFLIVIIVLWFGCNNAAKEIVKEDAIYSRERAVNLGLLPYLASKFLVLSFITILQTLLLMGCIYGTLEVFGWYFGWSVPFADYRLDYLPQFGVLAVLSMTGVALGLLLSACVSSPDQANALLPYVLIPQIILGGGILPIKGGPLHILAELLSPAYWGYRAVQRGATTMPADLPWHMDYNDSVWIACAALALQMVVLLITTAVFLRAKDLRKA
jgi:hypothetical protein